MKPEEKEILFRIIREKRKIRELAKETGLSPATVQRILKKLERDGIIKKYVALPDWAKAGLQVTAYIHVVVSEKGKAEEIARKLAEQWNVLSVDVVTGQFDIIVKAVFENIDALGRFIFEEVRCWPGVARTETMVVVKQIKDWI